MKNVWISFSCFTFKILVSFMLTHHHCHTVTLSRLELNRVIVNGISDTKVNTSTTSVLLFLVRDGYSEIWALTFSTMEIPLWNYLTIHEKKTCTLLEKHKKVKRALFARIKSLQPWTPDNQPTLLQEAIGSTTNLKNVWSNHNV